MTLAGASVGIAGALIFGRYLSTVLYGVTLSDPLTLAE
jgi:hypothetical protein